MRPRVTPPTCMGRREDFVRLARLNLTRLAIRKALRQQRLGNGLYYHGNGQWSHVIPVVST